MVISYCQSIYFMYFSSYCRHREAIHIPVIANEVKQSIASKHDKTHYGSIVVSLLVMTSSHCERSEVIDFVYTLYMILFGKSQKVSKKLFVPTVFTYSYPSYSGLLLLLLLPARACDWITIMILYLTIHTVWGRVAQYSSLRV